MASSLDDEKIVKACVACGKEFEGKLEICPVDGILLVPVGKEPKIGDIFAERYEILGIVGDGGMGKVYKAKHNLMKRLVAIKMLLPHLVQSAAALKRFQQEAQAASALNHPNILTVYDFGISADSGMPFLVMDYLEGRSLSVILQEQGSLSVARAIPIFIQACSALAHAHSKGVIHRDLKPANIMLVDFDGKQDFLKIVDFGIAKLLQVENSNDPNVEHLTQTGEVFGSPLYMSPEQCRGKDLDPRSDIYSLACVLYRTITGKPVFLGRDAMECMYKQVHDLPMSFNELCPELCLSESLEQTILKAMSKEMNERYQNMLEFRQALEQINDYQRSKQESSVSSNLVKNNSSEQISEVEKNVIDKSPAITQTSYLDNRVALILVFLAIIFGVIFKNTILSNKNTKDTIVANIKTNSLQSSKSLTGLEDKEIFSNSSNKSIKNDLYQESKNALTNGDYNLALNKLNEAMKAESKSKGENTENFATYLLDSAEIYMLQGNYAEAEKRLNQVHKTYENLYGKDSVQSANVYKDLGIINFKHGQIHKAESFYNKALSLNNKAFGSDSLASAEIMTALAMLYTSQHNFDKADKLFKNALLIRSQALGKDSPVTRRTHQLYATMLAEKSKQKK